MFAGQCHKIIWIQLYFIGILLKLKPDPKIWDLPGYGSWFGSRALLIRKKQNWRELAQPEKSLC